VIHDDGKFIRSIIALSISTTDEESDTYNAYNISARKLRMPIPMQAGKTPNTPRN
jgi:hypothetical protein